ncbi:MAG: hypothetical protein ACI3VN_06715 [Candidatus Onthomonas sp.]
MKPKQKLSILFLVIALIGLISWLAGTRNVNFGAFLFPALLSALFWYWSVRDQRK